MKTASPNDETQRFTPAEARRMADAFIERADHLTHKAADATLDHVVRPAVNAARDAAIALETRANQTNRFLSSTLHNIEEEIHRNPLRVLGYAVGAGVVIGLWLRRK